MVMLNVVLFSVPKSRAFLKSRFLDSLRILVKGGTGGTGLPKYGGVGGQGGCVYCIGKEGATLKSIVVGHPNKRIVAGNGEDSSKKKILGIPGKDQVLKVPLGLKIFREDGKLLGEINNEDEICIAARGGPGGGPNNRYLGREGQNYSIRLDLRLIADIGLVGFPNAGKSSLLKAISRAKPKIANYPFTTIKPNIATLQYEDLRQITMADLPGLIEGAHANFGLGHKFLKHVERTKLLLLIVDIDGFSLSNMHTHRSCLETVFLLNRELELYNSELLDKPAVLAVNKLDLDGAEEKYKELVKQLHNIDSYIPTLPDNAKCDKMIKFEEIVGISALCGGKSIDNLKNILRKVLDDKQLSLEVESNLAKTLQQNIREIGPKVT